MGQFEMEEGGREYQVARERESERENKKERESERQNKSDIKRERERDVNAIAIEIAIIK
jgi:hypothetical protein